MVEQVFFPPFSADMDKKPAGQEIGNESGWNSQNHTAAEHDFDGIPASTTQYVKA